jgi:hypothetical protein
MYVQHPGREARSGALAVDRAVAQALAAVTAVATIEVRVEGRHSIHALPHTADAPVHLPSLRVLDRPLRTQVSPSCLSQQGVSHVSDSELHNCSSTAHTGGSGHSRSLHLDAHLSRIVTNALYV